MPNKPSYLFGWTNDEISGTYHNLYTNDSILVENMPLYNNNGIKTEYVVGTILTTTSFNALQMCTLTIEPTPSDATVTFDIGDISENSTTVPYGTEVNYTVSKSGYNTAIGSEVVISTKTTTIELTTAPTYTLTVNPTPNDAIVTFDKGIINGNSTSVVSGTVVTYTISKEGYTTSSPASVTVTANTIVSAPPLTVAEIPETLLQRYNSGSFDYTIPSQYNYVRFVIAGAAGGRNWQSDGAGKYAQESPGRGAILEKTFNNISVRSVSGVVGESPIRTYSSEQYGGSGYNNGESSNRVGVTIDYICGGGGGGSTSLTYNNTTYEACGGSGRSSITQLNSSLYGGKGGGTYGGARQTGSYTNGNDATNPDLVDYNSGSGYIEIYAGYRN